jgi:hypothetical protein
MLISTQIRDVLNTRLPVGWSAEIDTPADAYSDGTLRLSTGSRRTIFAIEARMTSRTAVMQVISQVQADADRSALPLILMAEYINAPLRQACEELSINYADTTGWTYISNNDPPVFIRLEGAQKSPTSRGKEATTRLDGPASSRTIRYLLTARPPIGIRELAELSGSSPAAVSKLMPALEDAGAVERAREGAITRIRRRTLLDRWTTDYQFLRSNGVVLDYVAPRGVNKTLEQLRERADYSLTGSAAARMYLPSESISVVPLTLVTLYAREMTQLAGDLKLVRVARSESNVMITAPRDRELLWASRRPDAELTTAPLGQVLADLLTLPGRFPQEAEQLIEYLAGSDPTWSE